jgi:hypothetical protein
MIQFTLKCAKGHSFDSWFKSAAAFDKLQAAGLVVCSVCGETKVEKAMMAPSVSTRDTAPLSQPVSESEAALAKIRTHVEANSEDVGKRFAEEARAIHEGTSPERWIRGEAKQEDAKKLIDDGIPIAALPFTPTRKAN